MSSMLTDGIDGSLSSRRVITFCAFLLCAIAFVCNLFFGMSMEKFIFDSMSYIAMAGLGATVAEKFSGAEKMVVHEREKQHSYYAPNRNINTMSYQQSYNRMGGTPLPKQEDPLL